MDSTKDSITSDGSCKLGPNSQKLDASKIDLVEENVVAVNVVALAVVGCDNGQLGTYDTDSVDRRTDDLASLETNCMTDADHIDAFRFHVPYTLDNRDSLTGDYLALATNIGPDRLHTADVDLGSLVACYCSIAAGAIDFAIYGAWIRSSIVIVDCAGAVASRCAVANHNLLCRLSVVLASDAALERDALAFDSLNSLRD